MMTRRRTIAKSRRFKVQRRVDLFARDLSNVRFLLGTLWRTEVQADKQATAERILAHKIRERPDTEWRIAEQWPLSSEPRTIVAVQKASVRRLQRTVSTVP